MVLAFTDPLCANCGILGVKDVPFQAYGQCHAMTYCSRDCQRAHWKLAHRDVCRTDGSGVVLWTTLHRNTIVDAALHVLDFLCECDYPRVNHTAVEFSNLRHDQTRLGPMELIQFRKPRKMSVQEMCVLPALRRRGIATDLFNWLDKFKTTNVDAIDLHLPPLSFTEEWNMLSVIYDKLGFKMGADDMGPILTRPIRQ